MASCERGSPSVSCDLSQLSYFLSDGPVLAPGASATDRHRTVIQVNLNKMKPIPDLDNGLPSGDDLSFI